MDIDDLTIKQVKELASFFGDQKKSKNIFDKYIGKYVIIRSINEGVNAGYLEEADETGCVIREARRLHYHIPIDKTESWYEGVALTGLSSNSRISGAVSIKVIVEDYSITMVEEIAIKSIRGAKTNAQS